MAKYINGESTQEAIISSAGKLFQQGGIKKTTFYDIAKDSHVSRETIVYHFKTKEMLNKRVSYVEQEKIRKKIQKELNSPKMDLIMTSYIFWYRFLNDENYRKWTMESFTDDEDVPTETEIYPLLSSAYGLDEDQKTFMDKHVFAVLMVESIERRLCHYIGCNRPDNLDFMEIAEREVCLLSRVFSVPENKIQAYLMEANGYASSLDFQQIIDGIFR